MCSIRCKVCNKKADEISEYVGMGKAENMSPEAFVKKYEGTYNPEKGQFICTDCYIKIGCPKGRA